MTAPPRPAQLHKLSARLPKPLPFAAYSTYALAFLGAHLAFMPLFVLLLPRRVEALAAQDTAVWLSWLLLIGGIVAGIANVAAGALGDRWLARFGTRRGLIAIGAGLLLVAYVGLGLSWNVMSLMAAMVFFQLALNCCFSPLGALLTDHFPDEVKGRLGGWMTCALPMSSLLVLPLAWLFPEDGTLAFLITGGLISACILPLLVYWRLGPVITGLSEEMDIQNTAPSKALGRDFALAWSSRLLVQTGAAFVIGYIYLYVSTLQLSQSSWSDTGASEVLGALTAPAAIAAIAAALFSGYASDLAKSRRIPLFVFACLFGAGMAMLALTADFVWFLVGYIVLQSALAAYLGVDTALVAQLVGGHPKRGLLLGVMNLSNTLPSIIVPSMALLAFTDSQVAAILVKMFTGFAFAAVLAGALVLFIRGVR